MSTRGSQKSAENSVVWRLQWENILYIKSKTNWKGNEQTLVWCEKRKFQYLKFKLQCVQVPVREMLCCTAQFNICDSQGQKHILSLSQLVHKVVPTFLVATAFAPGGSWFGEFPSKHREGETPGKMITV